MDLNGGGGGRRRVSRETSPDRARVVGFVGAERCQGGRGRVLGAARRVQIVYYLSRNGQLEHPHFMEISLLPNQHVRLKDVMERLTVLRGKGLPSLYSWSCKRSYKNGYVWNDLSENDIIYPADGAEYVLKGSEIVTGCTSERFQQLQISNRSPKPLPTHHMIKDEEETEEEDEDEEEEECEEQQQQKHGKITRCSRGVSTDEIPHLQKKLLQTEISLEDGSPPSSSSSDPAPVEAAVPSSNSIFFNLIACGSSLAGAGVGTKGRKSGGNLHKGVVVTSRHVEDEEEVRYMSENPRFGNLQAEDKEYFSGSIVLEAMRSTCGGGENQLKKSSSYNEERSSKLGIGECLVAGENRGGGGVKGKCIPGSWKKHSSKLQQHSSKN